MRRNPPLIRGGDQGKIVVVSGLPRAGTSMLMQVLQAGGMALVTDQIRSPDVDNPRGYYEFERVKRLPQGDVSWLNDARGKCVKVISALLMYLPPDFTYDVIFMHRHIDEVISSQQKMLAHLGQATPDNGKDIAALLQQHVADVRNWLANQPNFSLFDADYNTILTQPSEWIARINTFLGGHLDVVAMQAAVDSTLYRNRIS